VSFDADFVTGNTITFTINGSAIAGVPFNSDQATTAADIVTALEAEAVVDSVALSGSNRIFTITANTGNVFFVDSAVVTGGATQANATIENPVLARISEIINNGDEPVTASDNEDGTMQIVANSVTVPFSLTVGTNLSITDISSSVNFLAQEYGPISAPQDTLTEILTPIGGWNSINNPVAGVTGRNVETDSELRIRRRNSIRLLGAATVEAIRARLLQQVDNVTSAFVFENRTMQQEDCSFTFNADLVTSNTIDVTLNTTPIATVTFSTDHDTTMQLIVNALETLTSLVLSASYGGADNRTITIVPVNGIEISVITVDVQNGASQATAVETIGRYPKSIECVVQGGTDQDVGDKIWEVKPAGIQTFGNTQVNVTDSQGGTQAIFFSRPTSIYIWVTCELTLYSEEEFPSNGTDLVAEAILAYGSSLGIGVDVLLQRVLCQIFDVSGIASGSMQIAATLAEGDSPSFGTSDISIGEAQISEWELDRINITVA
jgi:hypothetical protein